MYVCPRLLIINVHFQLPSERVGADVLHVHDLSLNAQTHLRGEERAAPELQRPRPAARRAPGGRPVVQLGALQ